LNLGIDYLADFLPPRTIADLRAQWPAMLLQRQLKAIGSFGYLTLEKRRGNYLKNVRPALATLAKDIVGDDRWPFISRDLPFRMLNECP